MAQHEWTTARLHEVMPFAAALGLVLDRAEPGVVVVSGLWVAELCTAGGVLHGGALMATADSAAGLCAQLNLPESAVGTTTIEAKTNFFAGIREGVFSAVASPVHVGHMTIVVQTDMLNADGHRVSRSMQTQAVLHDTGRGSGR
jgi:uncharacterized protein (TIGR00369 family)